MENCWENQKKKSHTYILVILIITKMHLELGQIPYLFFYLVFWRHISISLYVLTIHTYYYQYHWHAIRSDMIKLRKSKRLLRIGVLISFKKKFFFLLLSSTKKNDEEKENRKCMIVSVVSLIYFNCEIQFFLSISIQSDLYLSFCLYVSQKQSFFSIHS